MVKVLMACKDPVSLSGLADELSQRDRVSVRWCPSQQDALALIANEGVQVVVVGEELSSGPALPFIREVVKRQPFINCAMVSPLSAQDFHEVTEGLGVFMQLPVNPGAEEADRMLGLLASIGILGAEQQGDSKR